MTLPPDLVGVLGTHRDQIVSRFVEGVQRTALSPPGTPRSLLVDHIPTFLDEMVAALAPAESVRTSQDAVDTNPTARRHGKQRWVLGYDLDALVREYGILRHCILHAAREAGAVLSIDEFDVLAKFLSVGVAEAAAEYTTFRDQQLEAEKSHLAFLAEAGELLSSSLDHRSTLNRLTGLLVPRLADWCAVHLDDGSVDEMPIAHVDPAKVATLREIYRRYPLPADSPVGHPQVARTGEPQLVAAADPATFERLARDPEHLALLRAVGSCSWIVVPLRVQQHVFGAITLAYSDSKRHYVERDLVLAGEVARRASTAIDNSRLYELSQSERSRVEAATRAKDEFVAMVSHELRTPLNAILGWLRLMRGGTLTSEKREHAFDVIERNALAQGQLVGDLLDISSIITGKVRINPAQVDLANVVELAIEGVRPAADAKRIQIRSDVDRSNAVMRGDGDRLQQIVWNLLSNAVKFTPKGGSVDVRVRRVESDLEVTVADTGSGIDAAFLPHVFDSFRQSESGAARGHPGLGIGLSIARHLVELHGGAIEARSEGVGHGATFTVRLPISPLVSTTIGVARVPATEVSSVPAGEPAGQAGVRVLVVDDEPDARELVAYVFETAGMDTRAAGSAAEAMTMLDSFLPHVIVSDIGMPEEDGYSLIRRIRMLPDQKRSIPAIALTAFARNEDRKRALVEGFNLHMTKPVEPAALVSAVVGLLRPGSSVQPP